MNKQHLLIILIYPPGLGNLRLAIKPCVLLEKSIDILSMRSNILYR